MVSSAFKELSSKGVAWIFVPAVAFSGIFAGFFFEGDPLFGYLGVAGCVISSFILGIMAFLNKKKDLLALLAPMYALIIFNPWSEFSTGPVMQILYSLTILVVTLRFVIRFKSA